MSTPRRTAVVVVVAGVLAVPAVSGGVALQPADGPERLPTVLPDGSTEHDGPMSDTGAGLVELGGSGPVPGVLVVGYSRFEDPEPLGHDTRQRLYGVITDSPGVYVAELARRTDTHVSTVRYHLRVLAAAGLIERTTVHGRSHLSPAGSDAAPRPACAEDGTRRAVLVSLDREGEATGRELSERLGLTESTVSYHLQRLADDGLVERENDGRTVVNALATGLDAPATADD